MLTVIGSFISGAVAGIFFCLAIASLSTLPSTGVRARRGELTNWTAELFTLFISIALTVLVIYVTGWLSPKLLYTIAWWVGFGLVMVFVVPRAILEFLRSIVAVRNTRIESHMERIIEAIKASKSERSINLCHTNQ